MLTRLERTRAEKETQECTHRSQVSTHAESQKREPHLNTRAFVAPLQYVRACAMGCRAEIATPKNGRACRRWKHNLGIADPNCWRPHIRILCKKNHVHRWCGRHFSDRQDRTGQDRTGQDRTGQDRTGQDRTGQDRTGQDRTGQDRTGQDRTGQDRTGQDRTGQDRTGQDRTGQDRTGQDRTGQDRTGQDRTGQDRTGQTERQRDRQTDSTLVRCSNQVSHLALRA